jgi:hypothetical protein
MVRLIPRRRRQPHHTNPRPAATGRQHRALHPPARTRPTPWNESSRALRACRPSLGRMPALTEEKSQATSTLTVPHASNPLTSPSWSNAQTSSNGCRRQHRRSALSDEWLHRRRPPSGPPQARPPTRRLRDHRSPRRSQQPPAPTLIDPHRTARPNDADGQTGTRPERHLLASATSLVTHDDVLRAGEDDELGVGDAPWSATRHKSATCWRPTNSSRLDAQRPHTSATRRPARGGEERTTGLPRRAGDLNGATRTPRRASERQSPQTIRLLPAPLDTPCTLSELTTRR